MAHSKSWNPCLLPSFLLLSSSLFPFLPSFLGQQTLEVLHVVPYVRGRRRIEGAWWWVVVAWRWRAKADECCANRNVGMVAVTMINGQDDWAMPFPDFGERANKKQTIPSQGERVREQQLPVPPSLPSSLRPPQPPTLLRPPFSSFLRPPLSLSPLFEPLSCFPFIHAPTFILITFFI